MEIPPGCCFCSGILHFLVPAAGARASVDRIIASCMERVAPQQALGSEPNPSRSSVPLDRLQHVNGAGGGEAASRRETRRNPAFVETQSGDQQRAHREKSFSTSFLRDSKGASNAPFRPCTTTAQPGASPGRLNRTASRSLRRMRFLVTLPPRCLGTANPTFAPAWPSIFRQAAAK